MSVDFPAPDGPMIATNSPSAKREKTKQKILELKNKLKIHIQEEEYEKARKVQDEIDSLNKKLK
jgi:protein-arginine kinase activator protein McsA